MSEEKILAQIEFPLVQTYQVSPPEQRFASKCAAQPIADIVAKNCGACRGRNDQPYVYGIMRADSRPNENRFSRQRNADVLQQDNPEDSDTSVRRNEFV